jgi:uncharacterized protein YjiS (DUF1127 family)
MIDRFQNTLGRIAEHARKRSEYRMLMRQDDAFFRDIGIARSDLRAALFEGKLPN